MARRNTNKFAQPGQKYAGQVKIDAGPVQLTRWIRPLTRAEHDKTPGPEGTDLRPERRPERTGKVPGTPSGTGYNRQST